MSTRTWLGVLAVLLLAALAGSLLLYVKSDKVDLAGNARVIERFGTVRHDEQRLAQLVLSVRSGLLNQYDALAATGQALDRDAEALRADVARLTPIDAELESALAELDTAISEVRAGVEHFKADNAILKNSTYYVPTLGHRVSGLSGVGDDTELVHAVHRQVVAALRYSLIGDAGSAEEMRGATKELKDRVATMEHPPAQLTLLRQHAELILEKEPVVDARTRSVLEHRVAAALRNVGKVYDERFERQVREAAHYRRILYGWSVALLLALTAIGFQLRRLYAELEARVRERTRELDDAMGELWGEMRLASKIQMALVPERPELPGCELAAEMRAAEQVGGDYYDVVAGTEHDWILIGDVSGHGVSAGLVMMMCQTAVRTALSKNPGMMPDELLSCVNQVLTRNMQQLREDKYMTISALRRDRDGTFRVAGAHQDLYVFRAVRDAVEVIPTEGVWLGLRGSISELLPMWSFCLEPGDVLVLYTDGITEATKEGRLFDTEGLRAVLANAHEKAAAEVLSDVFAAVADHDVKDDATVLVVRQLEHPGAALPDP
jgi:serine phosphatase RsbU (regulator of sigma subunit)